MDSGGDMSEVLARGRRPRVTGAFHQDRRARKRYPLNLDLDYVVLLGRQSVQSGNGHLVDISSAGLRFARPGWPPPVLGLELEVSIQWPTCLDDGAPMQLKAAGTVVWTRGAETALRLHRLELRRCGQGFQGRTASAAG
jgi:PilZ domain